MKNLRYRVILLATTSTLVLASCSTAPSDYLTAEGDTCQAQRAEMKSVDDYFNQSLITGTAAGAGMGAAAGALAGGLAGGWRGAAIGAGVGAVAGGVGGYFASREQAARDRDELVQTIYDDASKENVQVNRATAAFSALADCRFAAANAIKANYRQGTLSESEAQAQLSRQRALFDQDMTYSEQIGAQMQKRNAEFVNAATELEKTEAQAGAEFAGPPAEQPETPVAPPAKVSPPKKAPAGRAVATKTTSSIKREALSGQDSVQVFNDTRQTYSSRASTEFNLLKSSA